MFKRVIVLGFLSIFILLSTYAKGETKMPRNDSLNEVINNIRHCVVQINLFVLGTKTEQKQKIPFHENRVAGSGFFINDKGYVITNAHVIREAEKYFRMVEENENIEVKDKIASVGIAIPDYFDESAGISIQGSFSVTAFKVIEIDDVNDIAILKTDRNPFEGEMTSGIQLGEKTLPIKVSVCKLHNEVPEEGTSVAISGYPLNSPTLITQQGIVSSTLYPFEIRKSGNEWPIKIIYSFSVDVDINPGNSGGPVYLANSGEVVGIASATWLSPIEVRDAQGSPSRIQGIQLFQKSGLSKVVPAREVIKLLDKNNIPWQ